MAMGTMTKKIWLIAVLASCAEAAEVTAEDDGEHVEVGEDDLPYLPYDPIDLETEKTQQMPSLIYLPGLPEVPEGFKFSNEQGVGVTVIDPKNTFFECNQCYGSINTFINHKKLNFKKYSGSAPTCTENVETHCEVACPDSDELREEAKICRACCSKQKKLKEDLIRMNADFKADQDKSSQAAVQGQRKFEGTWSKMLQNSRPLVYNKCQEERESLETLGASMQSRGLRAAHEQRAEQQNTFSKVFRMIKDEKFGRDFTKLHAASKLIGEKWRAKREGDKSRAETKIVIEAVKESCQSIAIQLQTDFEAANLKEQQKNLDKARETLGEEWEGIQKQYEETLSFSEQQIEALESEKGRQAIDMNGLFTKMRELEELVAQFGFFKDTEQKESDKEQAQTLESDIERIKQEISGITEGIDAVEEKMRAETDINERTKLILQSLKHNKDKTTKEEILKSKEKELAEIETNQIQFEASNAQNLALEEYVASTKQGIADFVAQIALIREQSLVKDNEINEKRREQAQNLETHEQEKRAFLEQKTDNEEKFKETVQQLAATAGMTAAVQEDMLNVGSTKCSNVCQSKDKDGKVTSRIAVRYGMELKSITEFCENIEYVKENKGKLDGMLSDLRVFAAEHVRLRMKQNGINTRNPDQETMIKYLMEIDEKKLTRKEAEKELGLFAEVTYNDANYKVQKLEETLLEESTEERIMRSLAELEGAVRHHR